MLERLQIHPEHAEESIEQPVAQASQEIVVQEIPEEDIFIDDLIEEARGIAANYKQKGGQ